MNNTVFTFPSGLRLAHQENKNVRTVALGIFFGVGSSHELPNENGLSHFLEHMMFKGTAKRSANDIVRELENNGINVNAFTTKLLTCFYTFSMDEEIEKCFDVLSDILLHSQFDKDEMERERSVILEEISIDEDDPQDTCLDLLSDAYFGENSLGRPILGSRENVSSFSRDDLVKYFNANYVASNCCITVCGNISFDDAKALVERYFEGQLRENIDYTWQEAKANVVSAYRYKYKDVAQANVSIAFKGFSSNDDVNPETTVIDNILGGGMSSRLFQIIREKMGLAYSVYTFNSRSIDNGYFGIDISTNTGSLRDAIIATKREILRFVDEGLTDEEFERGKKVMKSSTVMALESVSVVMRTLGRTALLGPKPYDMEESLRKIDALTKERLNEYIRRIFDFDNVCMAYVGKEIDFNPLEVFKEN